MQKKREENCFWKEKEQTSRWVLLLFFTWVVSNQADNSFLNIFTYRVIQLSRIYTY